MYQIIQLKPLLAALSLLLLFSCAAPQQAADDAAAPANESGTAAQTAAEPETEIISLLPTFEPVPSSILDNGRMWTFEHAPVEYFAETYNFDPDDAWFERARLGALRLPGCSASFISPNGLVMTNHHCVRDQITQIGREGERTLDDGFYAVTLSDERMIEDYYLDQLIDIRDLTDLILDEVDSAPIEQQAQVRSQVIQRVQAELSAEFDESENIVVQVVSLFNGGRYSAYFFRRYFDIRMVMAPELQIGYYGGDADNFTYPRYNLDMTFMRVYEDDAPLQTPFFFPFAIEGVRSGDGVFVIGNPGSTTRLNTVAQLTYAGQFQLDIIHRFLFHTLNSLDAIFELDPDTDEAQQLRNTIFSLRNAEKLYGGQVLAHRDPFLMGRRTDNENNFVAALRDNEALAAEYIPIIERIAEIQEQKAGLAPYPYIMSIGMQPNSALSSALLQRALVAYRLVHQDLSTEARTQALAGLTAIQDRDPAHERLLIENHLRYLADLLGDDSPYMRRILNGHDKAEVAAALVQNSAFATQEQTEAFAETAFREWSDPGLDYFNAFGSRLYENTLMFQLLSQEENQLETRLGRGWFAVYGTSIPPDATFSPRIADGVVAGYEYNGTIAPAYTTFYGMYDRHHSHNTDPQWALPERWATPTPSLDLSTPLNFVSTNDIIGGNSGSPVVNTRLEIVGLAFDGNVESMGSSTLILDDRSARAVSVDSRGMLEALRHVYRADRLVREIEDARHQR
ncbi:S46 family peptidase [Cyclonatronum proteinivorum]|nr:S46 family peptidase [Cyclonatronum proteinivorum]